MDDNEKVYTPVEVADNPFPQSEPVSTATTQGGSATTGNYQSPQTSSNSFPKKLIAHETISSVFNTVSKKVLQAFELVQSGGFQIGKYEDGVSGDMRITPNGLVARDMSGNTTIAVDADTGDVTIKGTLQSGSVISDSIVTGELQLGGKDNGDGTFTIFDSTDTALAQIDKNGIKLYQQTALQFIDATNDGVLGYFGPFGGAMWLSSASGIAFNMQAIGGSDWYFGSGPSYGGTLTVHGNFTVTGSKAATVPTSKGDKQFFAAESPDDTWFFTFAKSKGLLKKELEVDPLFYECTVEPYIKIPTLTKDIVQLWGRRKGYASTEASNFE